MVSPKMEYASSVWDPYHKTHITKLEGVQYRVDLHKQFHTNEKGVKVLLYP